MCIREAENVQLSVILAIYSFGPPSPRCLAVHVLSKAGCCWVLVQGRPGPRAPASPEFYVCSLWTRPCAIPFLKVYCRFQLRTLKYMHIQCPCMICAHYVYITSYHPLAINSKQTDPATDHKTTVGPRKRDRGYGMNDGYLGPFFRT